FAPERKRPLPKFPRRIGIVTSPTGAAIRDMLNVLRRRAPWLQILINPVRVQGTGAAQEIAVAIPELVLPNKAFASVDLIVITRAKRCNAASATRLRATSAVFSTSRERCRRAVPRGNS